MSGWAAAGQAAGDIGGGLLSFFGARNNARSNRRFQERMFRNRYQYTVEDMKAAGINPILAAGGGLGGGQSPSGSMAQTPDMSNLGKNVGTALKVSSERKLMEKQGHLIEANAGTAREQAGKYAAERRIIDAGLPLAEMNRDFYNSGPGQAAFYAEKIGGAFGALGAGVVGGLIGRGRRGNTQSGTRRALPQGAPGKKRKGRIEILSGPGKHYRGPPSLKGKNWKNLTVKEKELYKRWTEVQ